jgi:general stress protein YciG
MDQGPSQAKFATRGFARMNQEKQREIARKGGANVPNEKRSFSQNRALPPGYGNAAPSPGDLTAGRHVPSVAPFAGTDLLHI